MKKIVISIMLLSVFDAVCTAIGVSSGNVIETNQLFSSSVMGSPWVSCGLVCAGVCALLWLVYKLGSKYRWVHYALIAVLIERIAIAAVHIVGIAHI